MSKLQNNFTTPKQSKRLLELEVPVDSADCYYDSWGQIQWRQLKDLDHDFFQKYSHYTPCWTVGRLMEIYEIVGENAGQCVTTTKGTSRIESLVKLYEENAILLDFSKLE